MGIADLCCVYLMSQIVYTNLQALKLVLYSAHWYFDLIPQLN